MSAQPAFIEYTIAGEKSPRRISTLATQRTCNELGVCQALPYPCSGCTHIQDATEREYRKKLHELESAADAANDDTPTSFDTIAYWLAVGATTVASVALVFGLMGFAAVKLGLTG